MDLAHGSSLLVQEHGVHPLATLLAHAAQLGVTMVPVLGVRHQPALHQAALTTTGRLTNGACLRLAPSEISHPNLHEFVHGFLENAGLSEQHVDVIVDYGVCAPSGSGYALALERLPMVASWRTVAIAAGAFPKDLSAFSIGNHRHPRDDWTRWRDFAQEFGIPRVPSCSDYTIQRARHLEPPEYPNVSASIRYADDTHWIVMRGEGHRKNHAPGEWSRQYVGHARLLLEGKEYRGSSFSYGDAYVAGRARDPGHPGSPQTWLRAGINHHLVLTVHQVADIEREIATLAASPAVRTAAEHQRSAGLPQMARP